ncbi:glycerophosphodiester phosphodiesterase family protein [Providencia sp. PROV_01]
MRQNVKPTQEPVPSSDIKNLFFNSGLLDIWATSLEHKYIDRFGNCHLTAAGMEWLFKELVEKFKVDMNTAIVAAGYITIDSFQQGADLPNNELTQRNQILRDETTGEYYRWDGDLPKQVLAGSTPESTGGIGKGAWVSVGDAALRPLVNVLNSTVERIPLYFDTVNHLITEPIDSGVLVKTLGLRFKGDGGGAEYRIVSTAGVRPETKGYKITSYPTEFGDLELANGNIAIRLSPVETPDELRIWAHRGGQRGVAENTMYAFSQAIENGAHGVELDGCMSADGVWYVFHDAFVSDLTNGTGYVRDLTSSYMDSLKLKRLIGTRFENSVRIPRFSEFLKWAAENGVNFTVELKYKRTGKEVEDFLTGVQMIVDAGCESFAHVQVTTLKEALLIREVSKQIVISYSFANLNTPSDVVWIYKDFENVIIQTNTNGITPQYKETVKLIRALGGDVICYTSRDMELDIKKALEAGVRNIISDRGWENK